MTWITPKTWADQNLVTANDLNTELRDNLNALKSPPTVHYEANEASDYTTTSTTWTSVDATDGKFLLTLTTTGGDVLVGFSGAMTMSTAGRVYLDVQVDGSGGVAGDDGICFVDQTGGKSPVSFVRLIPVAAGTHTFALRWKTNAANTATMWAGAGTTGLDVHPQFWAREVS